MFGSLGIPEILFILVLALLIFGPRKLPQIGRTLGRSLSEFRKASTELKRSLNAEMIEEEMRQSDPREILDEAVSGEEERPGKRRRILDDVDSLGGSPNVTRRDAEPEPPPAAEPAAAAEDAGTVPRGSIPRGDDGAPAAPVPETVPEPEAQ